MGALCHQKTNFHSKGKRRCLLSMRIIYRARFFTCATLCYRGRPICCGPVSVCLSVFLSVTSQCCTKIGKHRITIQRPPHDSSGTLVILCKRSLRKPPTGAPNASGIGNKKISYRKGTARRAVLVASCCFTSSGCYKGGTLQK